MAAPMEVQVAKVVAEQGPCHLCGAAALYCDPAVREEDLEHITAPVPSPGYELVGVLRCAVCSTGGGFVTWGPKR